MIKLDPSFAENLKISYHTDNMTRHIVPFGQVLSDFLKNRDIQEQYLISEQRKTTTITTVLLDMIVFYKA